MCHEWWARRMREERAASRELWDEFERTEPLSEPKPADEDAEVTLESAEAPPVLSER